MDELERLKKENRRYKYSSVSMIILYIIITILDLLRNDLSNQAVMMFCIYMIADRIVSFVEEKKKSYIFSILFLIIIFFIFMGDYVLELELSLASI